MGNTPRVALGTASPAKAPALIKKTSEGPPKCSTQLAVATRKTAFISVHLETETMTTAAGTYVELRLRAFERAQNTTQPREVRGRCCSFE
jgi:hypothetical protein